MKRREFVAKATGASTALVLASQASAGTVPSADESLFYRPLTYREKLENLCEEMGWKLLVSAGWDVVLQSDVVSVSVRATTWGHSLQGIACFSREPQTQVIAPVKEELCERLYKQIANSPNMHEQQRRLIASGNRAGKTVSTTKSWKFYYRKQL